MKVPAKKSAKKEVLSLDGRFLRGTLYQQKGRYWYFSTCVNGKTICRSVPAGAVEAVKASMDGWSRIEKEVTDQTLAAIQSGFSGFVK